MTEGKSKMMDYQPNFGPLLDQFLSCLFLKIEESVNHAAKNVLEELKNEMKHEELKDVAEGFLTRTQIADLLCISMPTLHRYQCEGLVPVTRIGRKCLYNKSEVLEALKNAGKKKGRSILKT